MATGFLINGDEHRISFFPFDNDTFAIDYKYAVNELIYETDYCMVGMGVEYELTTGKEIISIQTPTRREIMIKKYVDLLGSSGHSWNWDLSRKVLNEMKVYNTLKDQTKMVTLIDIMLLMTYKSDEHKHRKIFNHKFSDMYLVFEKCGNDLGHILRKDPSRAIEFQKWLLIELLSAVSSLHSQKLIHRDLCPSNVCVSFEKNTLKLKSFGLSCGFSSKVYLDNTDDEDTNTANADYFVPMTPIYTAPEIILGDASSPLMDVWGVGCIFAEILSGGFPMFVLPSVLPEGRTVPTPTDKIVTILRTLETIDEVCSNTLAIDLLSRMLVFNPENRISLEEAKKHPYFGGETELVCGGGSSSRVAEEEDMAGVVEVTVPEVVEPDSHSLRNLIWTEMRTFERNNQK